MAMSDTARKTAETTKSASRKATTTAKSSAARAKKSATTSTRKATATVKATRAARAGLVEEAKEIAAEADLGEGRAEHAIAETEALHYDVEVNKRRLGVSGLTKTLNERWENGWRLGHVFEQRGNTVLVFEKRD